jgi:hypothetical protein
MLIAILAVLCVAVIFGMGALVAKAWLPQRYRSRRDRLLRRARQADADQALTEAWLPQLRDPVDPAVVERQLHKRRLF